MSVCQGPDGSGAGDEAVPSSGHGLRAQVVVDDLDELFVVLAHGGEHLPALGGIYAQDDGVDAGALVEAAEPVEVAGVVALLDVEVGYEIVDDDAGVAAADELVLPVGEDDSVAVAPGVVDAQAEGVGEDGGVVMVGCLGGAEDDYGLGHLVGDVVELGGVAAFGVRLEVAAEGSYAEVGEQEQCQQCEGFGEDSFHGRQKLT